MSKRKNQSSRGSLTVGRAVQLYLAEQFRVLEKTAPNLDHPDASCVAEAVHDLRVTCQQMRSVLKAFESDLPPKVADRLGRRIRGLQRQFGDVRDLEVLLAQPQLTPELRRPFEGQLVDALQDLLQECSGRKIARMAKKMRRCLLEPVMEINLNPAPLDSKGVVQIRRLDAVIPAVLYRQAAAVTAFRPFIPPLAGVAGYLAAEKTDAKGQPSGSVAVPVKVGGMHAEEPHLALSRFWTEPGRPSDAVLHRLRLAFKQFRHLLMMLCMLWGEQGDELITVCKQMQDRLGQLHDRTVLLEALYQRSLAHAGTDARVNGASRNPDGGAPADADLEMTAATALWPKLEALQAAETEAFLAAWQPMDMAWFHQRLRPLVDWSIEQASREEGPLPGGTADIRSGQSDS